MADTTTMNVPNQQSPNFVCSNCSLDIVGKRTRYHVILTCNIPPNGAIVAEATEIMQLIGEFINENSCNHPWHRNPGLITDCPECGERGAS